MNTFPSNASILCHFLYAKPTNKAEIWLGRVQDGTCEMHGVRLETALMKSVTQGALIQHCDF